MAQNMSNATNSSLVEILNTGFSTAFDYFNSETWNEQKKLLEYHDGIQVAILNSLNASLSRKR